MRMIITLTTDFGMADAFVGTMKGVILGINPQASIVDICHTIEPQNIAQGAFVLSTAYRYFPDSTIHLVVVDPGVGSGRRAIILKTPNFFFVAPDNGVLSYVLEENSPSATIGEGLPHRELGAGLEAVVLSNPRFWLTPASATFHGRDIFAPVAAYLSLGIPIREFGDEVFSVIAFPLSRPESVADGVLLGHVLHIDRFGNLITDVKTEDLTSFINFKLSLRAEALSRSPERSEGAAKGQSGNLARLLRRQAPRNDTKQSQDLLAEKICIKIGDRCIERISSSYEEGEELLALLGSSGNLEVAAKNKNASQVLGVKVGDKITLTRI